MDETRGIDKKKKNTPPPQKKKPAFFIFRDLASAHRCRAAAGNPQKPKQPF